MVKIYHDELQNQLQLATACLFCYSYVVKQLLLHNIRSAYNVGAIFRTADGAGFAKIYLTGHSPAPLDRFGRIQPEIKKTSLGASETLAWEQHTDVIQLITELQQSGNTVIAIEQSTKSISLKDFSVPEQVVYVLGNEVEGVSEEILAAVDQIVDIPMLGTKESLNVSVAAGIVMYHGIV